MRYLTLSADYLHYSITDRSGEAFDLTHVGAQTRRSLENWNEAYQPIIQLSMKERATPAVALQITALDDEGRELARRLARDVSDVKEVRYYSEGNLSY